MCGIVGTISARPIATDIYESLICLQHRGQDACGVATFNDQFHLVKGLGFVREVVREKHIGYLKGNIGIGHVRYSTVGGDGTYEDAQPFIVNSPYGISMAHNGNVYNIWDLKKDLMENDLRHVNSDSDVEAILHVFASALQESHNGDFFDSVCGAVQSVFRRVRGGYSIVSIIAGKGLLVFRDPHGIRPLVWGRRASDLPGGDHIFASENTSFQILGYDMQRDVAPGEVIFVDFDGNAQSRVVDRREFRPCIFEYVYFARPDATLNGVNVHRARLRMGQNLARKIRRLYPELPIDIVIPAPQSANVAALSCAHELGARYSQAIVKNMFVGRTFIMPDQVTRQRANKYKLSLIDFEVRGKDVLVVDDSIVRGNVSRHIIQMMRSSGARNVYFASTAPPLRYPDLYGIDLPIREEYVAHNRTEEQVREHIGADVLIYQDKEDLVEAVTRKGDLSFRRPHMAYFDADYPTEDVTEDVLAYVEEQRRREKSLC